MQNRRRVSPSRLSAYAQILSFNEISRLDGLNGLHRLQHLDLGYNVIEGVQQYRGVSPPTPDLAGGSIVHTGKSTSPVADKIPPNSSVRSHGNSSACEQLKPRDETAREVTAGTGERGGVGDAGAGDCRHSPVASAQINLPALTRLDLNNNILHDLDDLKVSAYRCSRCPRRRSFVGEFSPIWAIALKQNPIPSHRPLRVRDR